MTLMRALPAAAAAVVHGNGSATLPKDTIISSAPWMALAICVAVAVVGTVK